jgi:hypothetical protein
VQATYVAGNCVHDRDVTIYNNVNSAGEK